MAAIALATDGAIKSWKTTVLTSGQEAVAGIKRAEQVAKAYKPAR
jgi:hypothetical protein